MKKEIKSVILFLAGIMIGIIGTVKKLNRKIISNQKMSNKHLTLFLLMNQWVKVKHEGKNLSSYFEKRGYYEVWYRQKYSNFFRNRNGGNRGEAGKSRCYYCDGSKFF